MMYLSGLVGFLLVLTAEARVGNSSELEFCSETQQCLLFDLICERDMFQVRHYSAVKWVTTEETSFFMEIAAMRAFRRLFTYIDDNNIQMTSPVLMKIEDDKRFWQMGVYTMSFLLPAEHQRNPPPPGDKMVKISVMPAANMYVMKYGGWLTSSADKSNANALATALRRAGADYNEKFHYAVGYNSPWTMLNRHNEVWFEADDDLVCASSEEMEYAPFS